jgi:hypothetical protein
MQTYSRRIESFLEFYDADNKTTTHDGCEEGDDGKTETAVAGRDEHLRKL